MDSQLVKNTALSMGADLCGIAPVGRFTDAPEGFRPTDIFREAKSVVVIARRFPAASMLSQSPVPYSFAFDISLHEVKRITCELSLFFQDAGVNAVPVPSEPYEYWDEEKKEGRGILSLRHAGYLAGLGVLGKNTLLINNKYGNMITLGALLVDCSLEADPVAGYKLCRDSCRKCIEQCPAQALDGKTVMQKRCREKSNATNAKGYSFYVCSVCRVVCPNKNGNRFDDKKQED